MSCFDLFVVLEKKFLSLGLWSTSLTVLIVRFLYVCNMCVCELNITSRSRSMRFPYSFFLLLWSMIFFFLGYSKHIHKSNVIITNGRPRPFCDLFFFLVHHSFILMMIIIIWKSIGYQIGYSL